MPRSLEELRKKYAHITRPNEDFYININPLQRGGVLTPEAHRVLVEYGDGYSFCDNCLKGRIETIENPPMPDFYRDLAEYLQMDRAMVTGACRESKRLAFWVLRRMYPDRKTVVIDANAHYSSFMAIEANDLDIVEVPTTPHPENAVILDDYARVIDEVEDRTGVKPIAALLTHVDYNYGNFNDPTVVGNICKAKDVPFVLNGAYSVGTLDLHTKEWNVDFLTGSGHKSMAASGPIGVLGYAEKYHSILTAPSKLKGNITQKTYPRKSFSYLGCPAVYGAPLATLMASFPDMVARTQPDAVAEESAKANFIVNQLNRIEDIYVLGKLPKVHPLTNIETPGFLKIAEKHPRKGFFLREAFMKHGIIGMAPGISKKMKFSVYGLTWVQVKKVAEAFLSIARENGLYVAESPIVDKKYPGSGKIGTDFDED
jgi:Sep-tRNA:Cys-tRNA synthetase